MADKTPDYRDPKVTTTSTQKSGGGLSWLWIALAVILVLLLLAWFFGLFGGDEIDAVVAPAPTPDAVVVDPAPVVPAN